MVSRLPEEPALEEPGLVAVGQMKELVLEVAVG